MANKLGEAVLQANNMGKLKLGYSVDKYSKVLSALDKAKLIQEMLLYQQNQQSQNPNLNGQDNFFISTQTEYSTRLLQAGLLGGADEAGFVHGKYQAICTFKDFMGYTVDVTTDEGKKTLYVNRKAFDKHVSAGKGCIKGGGSIFPAYRKEKSGYYTKGLSSGEEPFKIGIGIDIKNFAVNFFNTFFDKGDDKKFIDDGIKIEKIAAIEALVAEVWIPQNIISSTKMTKDEQGRNRRLVRKSKQNVTVSQERQNVLNNINSTAENQNGSQQTRDENNYNAFVLHIKVIADIQSSGKYSHVYLPTPVLLLNAYSQFQSNVSIKTFSTSEKLRTRNIKMVDGKEVSFSFADKKFNHKTCTIDGFTPNFIDGIKEKDYAEHHMTTLCSETKEGRVRLYFDKDKKEEVLKILDITEEELNNKGWDKELFQGHFPESDVVQETTIITEQYGNIGASTATGEVTYAPGQINWDKFRAKHIRGKNLSKEHAEVIESVCKQYNINTRMAVAQVGFETEWFNSWAYKRKNNVGGLTVPGHYVDREGKVLDTSEAIKDEYPDPEERYRAYRSKYKCGQRYTLRNYGNVTAKAAEKDDTRGEGNGYYWIFDNIRDGYKAWAELVCNSNRYGINVKKPTTVEQHYNNLARGGYAESSGYAQELINTYNGLGRYV